VEFKGAFTAIITPLSGGKIDEQAFAKFINWQIEQGIHGLVPSGTTGESPTLDHDEHLEVIRICVETASGRVPVIAGTGSNATHEAISMTQHAQVAGADASLLVCPYYNKPTEAGLYAHYKAIHDNTDIPLILYNVPGRSVVDMSNELVAKLSELPRIIGIKDATGDLSRPEILTKSCGDDFIQISGEDDTAVKYNRLGGQAVISVSANVAPKQVAEVQQATLDGNYEKAEELQSKLMELHSVMFCETSPGPAKYGVSLLGFCTEELRLPLVSPSDENKAKVKSVMESLGLI
jgi:4-hydroxy-tetrahydrodipicolinate synthase